MKITKISGKTFDSLGTIFAYKERKFYLPKKEKLTEKELEDFIESAKRCERIYIPSSQVSDLTDTSLYNFEFDLAGDKKYIPNFYPGMLDDYSQDFLGKELDVFSSYMVPQISPSTSHNSFYYFGGFQDDEGNFIKLLKIPAGVWKLEIYNESRITENVIYENEHQIIEYNVVSNLVKDATPIYIPCIEIYFGPQYNTRIEGQSYTNALKNPIYRDRYFTVEDESIDLEGYYNDYPNVMSETEYVKNYKQEVLSEKILCLVYSGTSKEIKSINLIKTSFDNHNNPGRNQHKKSMRMDDYLGHNFTPIENKFDFIFDKSSGVILGMKKQEFPIFESKKQSRNQISLRDPKNKIVNINGHDYFNGNPERLYENPIISPDWIIQEGRNIDSNYKKCAIITSGEGDVLFSSVVKDGNNTVTPTEKVGGVMFFKKGSSFSLMPSAHTSWAFDKIEVSEGIPFKEEGKIYIFGTDDLNKDIPEKIKIFFNHVEYKFIINATCLKDYSEGGSKIEFRSDTEYFSENLKFYLEIGDSETGYIRYNWDEPIVIDDRNPISFRIVKDPKSIYLMSSEDELPHTIKLEDLKKSENYAIYDIFVEVIEPIITTIGDVTFKDKQIKINYNESVSIEFHSDHPDFKEKNKAFEHIWINGAPVYPDLYEYESNGDGCYKLIIKNIKSNINLEIWTE